MTSKDSWCGKQRVQVRRILRMAVGAGGLLALPMGCSAGACQSNEDCDDGKFCTAFDGCQFNFFPPVLFFIPTQCVSTGSPCSGSTPICDEAEDNCHPCESDAQCNDLNDCTDGFCITETGECSNQDCPDDGDPCTEDSCDGETCEHERSTCQRSEDCPGGCTCNDGLCSVP
jgi:hypothetical protein